MQLEQILESLEMPPALVIVLGELSAWQVQEVCILGEFYCGRSQLGRSRSDSTQRTLAKCSKKYDRCGAVKFCAFVCIVNVILPGHCI